MIIYRTLYSQPLRGLGRTSSLKPNLPHFFRTLSAMADQTPSRRIKNPALFVCDIQEKFRNAIFEFDKVVLTTQKVLKFASALNIPAYVTTQNKAKLGDTAGEVASALAGVEVKVTDDKTRFSMWTPAVREQLESSLLSSSSGGGGGGGGEKAAVALVGIEAHICVTQTALDLLAAGHAVYVLADGVSSCNRQEVPLALDRLRAAGAVVTSSESWVYELMGDASIPEFRAVAAVVKSSVPDTTAALSALLSKM